MVTPEKREERQESLEQKQNRINDFSELSDAGKRSFDDLSSELGKPKNGGERYETSDLQDAASKHLNKMIDASGVQVNKLNPDEKKKLEDIKKELLANMDGKSPKEAIEEFGKIRERIAGIIAAGDGKSKKNDIQFQQTQEQIRQSQEYTQDAFEKFQDFLQDARKNQEEQQKKANKQQHLAQEAWNQERLAARREADEILRTLA